MSVDGCCFRSASQIDFANNGFFRRIDGSDYRSVSVTDEYAIRFRVIKRKVGILRNRDLFRCSDMFK